MTDEEMTQQFIKKGKKMEKIFKIMKIILILLIKKKWMKII